MHDPKPRRLASLDQIGESGVTVIEDEALGALAVGISDGVPFATSNRCRHLAASLGKGLVADDGTLECPLHGARYDVRTGRMTRGPQGVFRPLAGVVQQTSGRLALSTHEVELRDDAIWLI